MEKIIVGTRGSSLAQWQTNYIVAALKIIAPALDVEIKIISTTGDRDQTTPLTQLGGRGVFTTEIEAALLRGEIDLAVHSLKDLPTELTPELMIAAVTERADARDCIISRHSIGLMQLPQGARVGTSSRRRAAQVLALRPDVEIVPLRGNVDTRLRKAQTDEYDAIVLAVAGVMRLGRDSEITEILALEKFLPDPGQGALAVQIRAGDEKLRALVAQLDHAPTRAAVIAEREFLARLGGGCSAPVGAFAEMRAGKLFLRGLVATLDGRNVLRGERAGTMDAAAELGRVLAQELLGRGGAEILVKGGMTPPLHGKRIVITRTREQASELGEKIRAQGGTVLEWATIAFAPLEDFGALDEALARVDEFDWIVFTSANGVRAVAERLDCKSSRAPNARVDMQSTISRLKSKRVAAIGPGTARALEAMGVPVAFIPTRFLGAQLARELPIRKGERALLLRADLACDELANGLHARGVLVQDVDAYRTKMPDTPPLDLRDADAITFASASAANNFMAMLDDSAREQLAALDIFCIGPVTEQAARELGLHISAVAKEHTLDGLVEVMVNYYAGIRE